MMNERFLFGLETKKSPQPCSTGKKIFVGVLQDSCKIIFSCMIFVYSIFFCQSLANKNEYCKILAGYLRKMKCYSKKSAGKNPVKIQKETCWHLLFAFLIPSNKVAIVFKKENVSTFMCSH